MQGTEKLEPLEKRKRWSIGEDEKVRNRRSVGEGDFQQALCEVNERVFRPRAARRSVDLNDTQVSS